MKRTLRRYLPPVCVLEILLSWTQSAHKSQKVEEIIKSCHAELRFLPPYSPDLNPIEKMWSKVKQILRGLMARAEDTLSTAIGTALSQVTAADACGWYGSCGYFIPEGQNF